MPIPTPFHPCTSALCETQEWRDWAGYFAAGTYQPSYEIEYYAIRTAAALIDVTPLYKHEVRGPDAARLLNRAITRDIQRCEIGQVFYTPWCDDAGKVVDDGTVQRLADDWFRVTAADSNLRWLEDCGVGMDAKVVDLTEELAVLAIQGPNSRAILQSLIQDVDLETMGYFRLAQGELAGIPLTISRTGYTGDLGYELWVEPSSAVQLWEVLMEAGAGYGLSPAGIVALDIARIEAGLLMIDVDYISSRKAMIPDHLSSPYEIGLGWTVDLNKPNFVGMAALAAEKAGQPVWKFVGLEVSWTSLEDLYGDADLPPQVAGRASRESLPIFHDGKQVGQATSTTFSPILKKYLAIGMVEAEYAELGMDLELEITVVYSRKRAQAKVVKTPFYDPVWKRD